MCLLEETAMGECGVHLVVLLNRVLLKVESAVEIFPVQQQRAVEGELAGLDLRPDGNVLRIRKNWQGKGGLHRTGGCDIGNRVERRRRLDIHRNRVIERNPYLSAHTHTAVPTIDDSLTVESIFWWDSSIVPLGRLSNGTEEVEMTNGIAWDFLLCRMVATGQQEAPRITANTAKRSVRKTI